jgi:acetate kinase
MNVLVLNCGSAAVRFAVVHSSNGHEHVSGIAQHLGTPQARLDFDHEGRKGTRPLAGAEHEDALRAVLDLLREVGLLDRMVGI